MGIAAAGVLCILMYWGKHVYYRAVKAEEIEKRIWKLEKARDLYPADDEVSNELGKAYFERGMENLLEPDEGQEYFEEAARCFKHCLRINPAYKYAHFNYAQVLEYLSAMGMEEIAFTGSEGLYIKEYKRAALLAGHNSEIYFEVGKVMLKHWPELSGEDRDYAASIIRKIITGKESKRVEELFDFWFINEGDYDVMEKALPEEPEIYRKYAEFLGEKSLSIEERHRVLAEAESMEFADIMDEYEKGEIESQYFRYDNAVKNFRRCLNGLEGLRFYQELNGSKEIDRGKYKEIKKQANLKLLKCLLEQRERERSLDQVKEYISAYLELEDANNAVKELENYLAAHKLLADKLEGSLPDLEKLALHVKLYLKQGRYREVMHLGSTLKGSFVVVPEERKSDYLEVLLLIGDAYQRIDYIYDAGDYYRRALEVDEGSLGGLVRMRAYYERLNNSGELKRIDKKIDSVLSQKNKRIQQQEIQKGKMFRRRIYSDGEPLTLRFMVEETGGGYVPLVGVFFNGEVVWEDYASNGIIEISVDTELGENWLEVVPVNRNIKISE